MPGHNNRQGVEQFVGAGVRCIVDMLEGYSFADDHVRLTSSFQFDPTMHALWAGIHLQWTGDVTTSLQLGCLLFGAQSIAGRQYPNGCLSMQC